MGWKEKRKRATFLQYIYNTEQNSNLVSFCPPGNIGSHLKKKKKKRVCYFIECELNSLVTDLFTFQNEHCCHFLCITTPQSVVTLS